MKKRVVALFLSIMMVFSLAACGSSSSTSGGAMTNATGGAAASTDTSDLPTVTWKMGSVWGSGNVHFTVDQYFAELVSTYTNGKFQITNYAEGELCNATQLFDYVQDGTVQAGGDWAGYWAGKDTAFELLSTTMCSVGFTGMDYLLWFNQGGGLEVAQDLYGQYNMTWFPITVHYSESGVRSNTPITTIADMQKLKIRLGGVCAGRAAAKLGINVTAVSGSELYEALMRGVIDAGEFSGPNADASLKLDEVTTYWCEPCWYQTSGNNGVMVNLDAWNALPEEYQKAFTLAAETCRGNQLARYTYLDCQAANKMLEDGITVTHLEDDAQAQILQVCTEVYEEEAASNENFAKVYDSMMSYRETVDPYRDMLNYGGYGFGTSMAD